MKLKNAVLDGIITQGILPLFYYDDAVVSIEVVKTLYRAGIRVIEYTNRGPNAPANFKSIKQQAGDMPGLLLGIGTIKTTDEAETFIDAGADFIVSPIINPEVAKIAHQHHLLWIPGCMTPTEIHLAQERGASLVKIFPANIVGPAFISSVKDIFPGMLFIPTGGVELEPKNISNWFQAGVCAVGFGSRLITPEILGNRDYIQLYENTIKAVELIKAVI